VNSADRSCYPDLNRAANRARFISERIWVARLRNEGRGDPPTTPFVPQGVPPRHEPCRKPTYLRVGPRVRAVWRKRRVPPVIGIPTHDGRATQRVGNIDRHVEPIGMEAIRKPSASGALGSSPQPPPPRGDTSEPVSRKSSCRDNVIIEELAAVLREQFRGATRAGPPNGTGNSRGTRPQPNPSGPTKKQSAGFP